eukprot:TRINITY_DN14708_c0_g1_i2.p1 TRINITY_DN14708_c0_g1~~TRINITY_DN14708_c0_g1_i2.p1  ORF type:complete len:1114 (+),score=316.03 TRINITY_DN14708_c0_g1_i2:101-3442(+)
MATLLRPEDVEDMREWGHHLARKWKQKKENAGQSWHQHVDIEDDAVVDWISGDMKDEEFQERSHKPATSLLMQISKILLKRKAVEHDRAVRTRKKLAEPLTTEGVKMRLQHLQRDLGNTGEKTMQLEEFIDYFSTDPRTRFDIQFVSHMRSVAVDRLGMWMYFPFLILFVYFLVEGKQLGNGFWMVSTLVDKFADEEFSQSDDLRYKKTFFDVANDGEFWEFIEGPLIQSAWTQDGPANQWVQASNMPIGALKLRQLRIQGEACPSSWRDILENYYWTLPPDRVVSRVSDFRPLCYPEYTFIGTDDPAGSTDRRHGTSYELISVTHSGVSLHNAGGSAANPAVTTPSPPCPSSARDCHGRASFPEAFVFRRTLEPNPDPYEYLALDPAEAAAHEAYRWRSCDALNSSDVATYSGMAGLYKCDGHAQIIPFDWPLAKVNQVKDLLKDGITVTYWDPFAQANTTKQVPWVDHQTRAISAEFFTYNQNLAVIAHLQFFVEVTAGGAFIPNVKSNIFKLFDWEDHGIWYYLFLALYLAWIVEFIVAWVWDLVDTASNNLTALSQSEKAAFRSSWRLRAEAVLDAISSFWKWFDLANLTLFVVSWVLRIRAMIIGMTDENLLQNKHYPRSYEEVSVMTEAAALVSAFNAMLVFLRVFYFLKLNPRLNLLTKTIEMASGDLIGIIVIFIFIFIAFAMMCYTVYGHIDENYRTFQDTCTSLLLMLLGDFDFVALREGRRMFTPIFFALFQILVVFLLFNMVIAVLGDAFSKVQEQKYNDGDLVQQLLEKSDTPERWTGPWDVPHPILQNPVIVQATYNFKRAVLWLKYCSGRDKEVEDSDEERSPLKKTAPDEEGVDEPETPKRARGGFFCCRWRIRDPEYRMQLETVKDRNPITYWKKKEDTFYRKKRCIHFQHYLQLSSDTLGDLLDRTFGQDTNKLLEDIETGEEGLVLAGARQTHTVPELMMHDMFEFHHDWVQLVSGTTTQGSAENWQEEKQAKEGSSLAEETAVEFAKDPQGRWDELRKLIRLLNEELGRVAGDKDDDGRMKGCGTKRVDVLESLKGQVQSAVETEIDDLLQAQVKATLDQLLDKAMPQWVRGLVSDVVTDEAHGAADAALRGA